MYTVTSIMTQLTNPEVVLQKLRATLRKIDPEFAKEEQNYNKAVLALKNTFGSLISPSPTEYLTAMEQKICAELIYVAWLGFQQNLACFRNPVNSLFLNMDYEDLHQERRMYNLPLVQQSLSVIGAFHDALRSFPSEKEALTEGISEYMSYLETIGYKLAHYFGFILADQFLHHVVPGYMKDTEITMQYTQQLQEYLLLDLRSLG